MSDGSQNGWNEYSKLVLKELETLASKFDAVRAELQEVKQEMVAMRVKENRVNELKAWKEKIDEVASPTQLQNAIKEIEDLKLFKTKAITIFAVVQFAMAVIVFATKVI